MDHLDKSKVDEYELKKNYKTNNSKYTRGNLRFYVSFILVWTF